MRSLRLMYASAYKELSTKRRYIANTVFSMLLFYILFLLLIGGFNMLGESNSLSYGTTFSGIVVSYYAWTMILSVFTSSAYIVQSNRQYGTLENMISNSSNYLLLVISENIVSMFFYFIFSWVNLWLFSLTAGIEISIHFGTVFVTLIIGLISILGLSLILAGITLIMRKVESVLNLIQFALLGALFLPDSIFCKALVPFFQANNMLKLSLIGDLSITNMGISQVSLLLTNAGLYLLMGCLFFSYCINTAKKKGILDFY